ncbi:hypothetical protein ACIBF1_23485 [Spirillospora sp. NPDC050679]
MRKPLEGLFRREQPEDPAQVGFEGNASERLPAAAPPAPGQGTGRPPLCYFDARHGPATERANWTPPDEPPRLIEVCAADARRLSEHRAPLDPAFKFLTPLPPEDQAAT